MNLDNLTQDLEHYLRNNSRSRRLQAQPFSRITPCPVDNIQSNPGFFEYQAPPPVETCTIIRSNILINEKYTAEITVKDNVFMAGDLLSLGSTTSNVLVTDVELVDENEAVLICDLVGDSINIQSLRPGNIVKKVATVNSRPIGKYRSRGHSTLIQEYLETLDIDKLRKAAELDAFRKMYEQCRIRPNEPQTTADNNQRAATRTRLDYINPRPSRRNR